MQIRVQSQKLLSFFAAIGKPDDTGCQFFMFGTQNR